VLQPGNLSYIAGPVIAIVVMALLALFMRWAFGGPGSRTKRRAAPADDGLLTRVATLSREESALALRAVLSDAGIRSTVLVFPEDAARARELAAAFAGPDAS
jgi:hypothetical protein